MGGNTYEFSEERGTGREASTERSRSLVRRCGMKRSHKPLHRKARRGDVDGRGDVVRARALRSPVVRGRATHSPPRNIPSRPAHYALPRLITSFSPHAAAFGPLYVSKESDTPGIGTQTRECWRAASVSLRSSARALPLDRLQHQHSPSYGERNRSDVGKTDVFEPQG